ncbi:MAG: hypothetical protein ACRDV2_09195, partial [Actinomycetes bacterium]
AGPERRCHRGEPVIIWVLAPTPDRRNLNSGVPMKYLTREAPKLPASPPEHVAGPDAVWQATVYPEVPGAVSP